MRIFEPAPIKNNGNDLGVYFKNLVKLSTEFKVKNRLTFPPVPNQVFLPIL